MGLVGCVAIGFQVSGRRWEFRDGRDEARELSVTAPMNADDGWFQMSPFLLYKGGGVKRLKGLFFRGPT